MEKKYYYIIMSQNEMFENQVLEEILRERANSYFLKSKALDFWLVVNPDFFQFSEILTNLEESQFYKQNLFNILDSSKRKFYNSLISTDPIFINWIKLRLGYFENIENKKDNPNKNSYVSDGICGSMILDREKKLNDFLVSNNNHIHPNILLNKYKKKLETVLSLDK